MKLKSTKDGSDEINVSDGTSFQGAALPTALSDPIVMASP